MRVVLASKSPRRKEILESLKVEFEIITADTPEESESVVAEEYTSDISREKCLAVRNLIADNDALIISADTSVFIDGTILGKPKSKDDAFKMLKKLSGKTHSVVTAITLSYKEKLYTDCEVTTVEFSEMSDEDIKRYVATGEPMDKAGSYAVQGIASLWIEKINGCYFNVVGFPTRLFYKMLCKIGVKFSEISKL